MNIKTKTINPVLGFAGTLAVGKTVATKRLESRHGYRIDTPYDHGGPMSKGETIEPVDDYLTLGRLHASDGLLVWVGPRDDSEMCNQADHYLDSIQDVGYEEFISRVDHLVEALQQC